MFQCFKSQIPKLRSQIYKMEVQNNQNQSRFIIAAVLSLVVLLAWSYFYAPTKPPVNSNTADVANANTAPQPAATVPPAQQQQPQQSVVATPDTTPNRTITIKSPLYEVTLDSKGAVATS